MVYRRGPVRAPTGFNDGSPPTVSKADACKAGTRDGLKRVPDCFSPSALPTSTFWGYGPFLKGCLKLKI